jgi:endonuclease/exonuclease/phosphatase family metal-dependent hydrolase
MESKSRINKEHKFTELSLPQHVSSGSTYEGWKTPFISYTKDIFTAFRFALGRASVNTSTSIQLYKFDISDVTDVATYIKNQEYHKLYNDFMGTAHSTYDINIILNRIKTMTNITARTNFSIMLSNKDTLNINYENIKNLINFYGHLIRIYELSNTASEYVCKVSKHDTNSFPGEELSCITLKVNEELYYWYIFFIYNYEKIPTNLSDKLYDYLPFNVKKQFYNKLMSNTSLTSLTSGHEYKDLKHIIKLGEGNNPVISEVINDNEVITVMSFNMFNGKCPNLKQICDKLLNDDLPHIICIQESPDIYNCIDLYNFHTFKSTDAFTYNIRVIESETKNENIGLLVKSTDYKFITGKIITTDVNIDDLSEYVIKRIGFIYWYKSVPIANLHLEGERFFDVNFAKCLSQNDNNLIVKLINYKLTLLREILKHDPTIIMGDFNSVFHNNPEIKKQYYESQYNYFKTIINEDKELKDKELTDEQKKYIQELNDKPFELLIKDYDLLSPIDETNFTNIRGKTRVDFIFVKKDAFEILDIQIIDLFKDNDLDMETCISDHNPIYAKLKFKKTPRQTGGGGLVQVSDEQKKYDKIYNKYLKYKLKYNNIQK